MSWLEEDLDVGGGEGFLLSLALRSLPLGIDLRENTLLGHATPMVAVRT